MKATRAQLEALLAEGQESLLATRSPSPHSARARCIAPRLALTLVDDAFTPCRLVLRAEASAEAR